MNNDVLYNRNYLKSAQPEFGFPDQVESARKPRINITNGNPFRIGATPGAIAGALVGGAMAKRTVEKRDEQERLRANAQAAIDAPAIDGNYYNQVQNVAQNLEVIFTPMSAIYTVRNGKKDFTLDTIETGEMNDDMKMAWQQKDANYFKGVMVSKMMTEMQLAEQGFAKRFLKKQLQMNDMITKQASDSSYIDDMNEVDTIIEIEKVASLLCGSEIKEKLASAIIKDIESECDSFYIDCKLDRPLSKYAGVISGISSSLGFGSTDDNINNVKKKLSDPQYTMKNIKIGFFPDRVIFSLGNQLVSTLPLLAMNDEGYAHFEQKDSKYFKNFFANNVKQMMSKSADVSIEYGMEKVAEEDINENCLLSSDSHPVTIYLYLTGKLGVEWLKYDIAIIEDILKTELGVSDIPETSMNKVMTILMANQSDSPYLSAYAFEKAVLSLCSKPVDFLSKEKSMVYIQDIVFAIDVLDRVTPHDDIYDNFSKEVLNYMCDVLSDNDMYVYNPTNIIMSPMEPAFNELLNELLIRLVKGKMTLSSTSEELDNEINLKCEYIADNALGILKSIRRFMGENSQLENINRDDLVEKIITKKEIRDDLKHMVKKQVMINLGLDDILSMYENSLQSQLSLYGIIRPEGE